jgi:NTP pyrophosphatase (non-canonical NTP hydrolase)
MLKKATVHRLGRASVSLRVVERLRSSLIALWQPRWLGARGARDRAGIENMSALGADMPRHGYGNRGGEQTVNDDKTTVAELIKLVDDFVAERDWQPFHDPKNLSMSLAIEAAELMEHFQWLRSEELDSVKRDEKAMAEVRDEVADIAAYLLSFVDEMDIDLSSALKDKMNRNALKYPAEKYRGRFK